MYISASTSLGYTYIYCYRTSPPRILVGLTAVPYIYVRERCFIMRAERSGHIFPVYALLVRCIPSRQKEPVLCRKKLVGSGI